MSVNRYNATTDTMEHIAGNEAIILDEVPTEGSNNAVKSGGVFAELANKANLTQISNPNLLDNPWFTVNQRGQSSYSLSNSAYTVDRWKSLLTAGTVSIGVNSNGVQITETSNVDDGIFYQLISNQSLLGGKTVTISIDDGTNIYHATGVTLSAKPVNWEYICAVETTNGVRLELVQSPTYVADYDFYLGIRVPKDGTAYTIKAIKLELGSVSTLAMDTAPNYQQELAKCQRYFYKSLVVNTDETVDQCQIFTKIVDTNVVWTNGFRFPTRMRVTPTITTKSIRPANGAYMPISNPSVSYLATQDGVTSSNFVEVNYIDGMILYYEIEASADL